MTHTPRNIGFQPLRSVVQADPPRQDNEQDQKFDHAISIKNQDINAIELLAIFAGRQTGDETFKANFWSGKGNGPARLVATALFYAGQIPVSFDPYTGEELTTGTYHYPGQVVIQASDWIKPIYRNQGSQIAGLWWDGFGYEWLAVEVTEMTPLTELKFYFSYL